MISYVILCKFIKSLIETKYTYYKSKYKTNAVEVPQGSVMGSFLFLLYINYRPNATRQNTILFADDTVLVIKCNDKNKLELYVNEPNKDIIIRLNSDNIKININKIKLI